MAARWLFSDLEAIRDFRGQECEEVRGPVGFPNQQRERNLVCPHRRRRVGAEATRSCDQREGHRGEQEGAVGPGSQDCTSLSTLSLTPCSN